MPLRIMLVNAPNELNHDQASNCACYPHIGIVQLATAARAEFGSEVEVEVVDGGISDTAAVQDAIRTSKPEVVGISALTPTYGEALKIAATAQREGATVVLGDDHAGFFPEWILRSRPCVDYVIANDVGEVPFVEFVGAVLGRTSLERVSSLVHREGDAIKRNAAPRYALTDRSTIPDLALIEGDLEVYGRNYSRQFGHLHAHTVKPITINNARGCENGKKRCTYCSIADLVVNTGEPSVFWDAVERYHSEFGINLFFEVYDSFTASPRYVESLIAAMPRRIGRKLDGGEIQLMVYARALGLTKRNNTEKLRRLGVTRANIGLDAADSEMLEAQRKNKTTYETNIEAIRLLNCAGISVHASYIAGAPGEREDTLERTINGIRRMLGEVELASVEFSRFIPLPNSPAWDLVADYDHPRFFRDQAEIDLYLERLGISMTLEEHRCLSVRYRERDLLDIDELARVWIENFTHIDHEYALERIAEADAVIRAHNVRTGKNVG
jgi:radical SAM superfamily enzyme YgiQ (UPF0313 family)